MLCINDTKYHTIFKMNTCFFVSILIAIFVSIHYEVSAKPTLKIVNGTTAEEGEFPYAVELRDSTGFFLCGGSILAPEWILTAAHCVADLDNGSTIVYGTTKLYDEGDGAPNTSIAIKKLYKHPWFTYNDSQSLPEYDVGLLQLAEPITFNEFAQPIKVAEDNINIPVHVDGVLSGWGGYNHQGDLPPYLQKINLQLLTDEECKIAVDAFWDEDSFNPIHNLCTNDYYNGGCYGDSGSPYVINGTQYGLISWSFAPCLGIVPNTYSRITNPEYRNWIRNITNV